MIQEKPVPGAAGKVLGLDTMKVGHNIIVLHIYFGCREGQIPDINPDKGGRDSIIVINLFVCAVPESEDTVPGPVLRRSAEYIAIFDIDIPAVIYPHSHPVGLIETTHISRKIRDLNSIKTQTAGIIYHDAPPDFCDKIRYSRRVRKILTDKKRRGIGKMDRCKRSGRQIIRRRNIGGRIRREGVTGKFGGIPEINEGNETGNAKTDVIINECVVYEFDFRLFLSENPYLRVAQCTPGHIQLSAGNRQRVERFRRQDNSAPQCTASF